MSTITENQPPSASDDEGWLFRGRRVQILCCEAQDPEQTGAYPVVENFSGVKTGHRMNVPEGGPKGFVTVIRHNPAYPNVLLLQTDSGARYAVVSPF